MPNPTNLNYVSLANAGGTYQNFNPIPVNSTTTTTPMTPSNGGGSDANIIFPANYLYGGMTFRCTAYGFYSASVSPTLDLGIAWGTATTASVSGNLLVHTTATTVVANAGNQVWRMEAYISPFLFAVAQNFTLSAFKVSGFAVGIGGSATTVMMTGNGGLTPTASGNVNQSIAGGPIPVCKWGTSLGADTISCVGWFVEQLG